MGHCYHHALSSARKWGGVAEDYLPLHQWFDVIWTVKPFSDRSSIEVVVCDPPRKSASGCIGSYNAEYRAVGTGAEQ